MKVHFIPIAILAIVTSTLAPAEEEETIYQLEDFVVTATGSVKSTLDAPGALEVISASEMQEVNALTVAEALETAVGVAVSKDSGRVLVPSIRGTRSRQTLVLLDGRRLAFGFNDSIDLRQIPTVMVERIEILRGPGSALYGSDALGGVVNIITKQAPQQFGGMAKGQYGVNRSGEAEEFIGSGLVGIPLTERFRILVSAEVGQKDGWDESGKLPDDGFAEEPEFLAARAAFDVTDSQTLSAGFEYMANTFTGDQFFAKQKRERIGDEERLGYFLQYDATVRDFDQLLLRVNRSDYEHILGFKPFAAPGDRDIEQATTQAEARYSGRFFKDHLLTFGAEYRRDELEDRLNTTRNDEEVDTASVLLQDEFQLSEPLYALIGLRYDDNSTFGGQLSPRASLVYSLDANTRLKASVGRGFRAPALTELYVTSLRKRGKVEFQANPDLTPEKSTNFELGIEGDYSRFRGRLTGFYNEIDDLIETAFVRSVGSGPGKRDIFRYQNVGESTIKGIEAEAGIDLGMGFALDGNLTWLEVESDADGGDIGGKPDFKGFLKLSYTQPESRLRANLRLSYVGDLTYSNGDSFSYPVFGAFVSKGLNDDLELFAGVDNILNKSFEHQNVVQIEPTTFYGGVTFKF
jgi:outer membrane receptor for ferrienterochelin and colicins